MLFTDGMRVGWAELRSAWRLPGRALLMGLPLTLVITAAFAHWVAGLPWIESFLIGAVLAPTDPVFAAALVGNDKVPARLRQLLNVESGVNDGLALPFVLIFLATASGSPDLQLGALAGELVLGLAIGVAVPWVAIRLEATRFFSASAGYQPLNAFAIGLLVLALGQVTHGNLYLAAFAAGITIATCGPQQRESFEQFGELLAELFKLAALLVFGALISPAFLAEIPWGGWVFAVFGVGCCAAGGAGRVVPGLRAEHAGTGGGGVVRSQGVRRRRVRTDRAGIADPRRRRGLPPGGGHHRAVHPGSFLHRRTGRSLVRRTHRDTALAREDHLRAAPVGRPSRGRRSRIGAPAIAPRAGARPLTTVPRPCCGASRY
ncbi:MAG TPA: cation:proton antiporter [Mycobacterium sp.]